MAGDKKMSNKEKMKFCNLHSFVKEYNPSLYEILDDMCAVGLFRPRDPVTFLNPNEKIIKKLSDMIDDGNGESAFKELQKLFIYGKHTKLNGDLINYNTKLITSDLSKLNESKNFKSWQNRDNIIVFEYTNDKFPEEGAKAPRPKFEKKRYVEGQGETCTLKMEATKELFSNLNDDKLNHKVAYALNSLLECLKKRNEEQYKKAIVLLDPNMILSWYILVQPSNENDGHIPNSVFNEWYEIKNNTVNSVNLIKEAFNSNNYDNSILAKNQTIRKELLTDGFEITKNSIMASYSGNLAKLLEDELRFRYSNEEKLSSFEIHELNNINWSNPKESLVLVTDPSKHCLYKSSLHQLMKEFIESNAFHYTMYNDKVHEKFEKNIVGAGSKKMITLLGKNNRKFIKKLEKTDDDKSLSNLISSLNKNQLKYLKKVINGLV